MIVFRLVMLSARLQDMFARVRGALSLSAKFAKVGLGTVLIVPGVLMLTRLDRSIEAADVVDGIDHGFLKCLLVPSFLMAVERCRQTQVASHRTELYGWPAKSLRQ